MQEDMHYYGTLYLAEKAGIPREDARTIAYAAQYVDDSTKQDSREHEDGGLLYGIASAHHPWRCAVNKVVDSHQQRRVWVPFHFLPGGEGRSLEEKLVCTKDSPIAREMFRNHLAKDCEYRVHLIGVACHVYMDTFSHYGFSGISSKFNTVDEDSLELSVRNEEMKAFLLTKMGRFLETFGLESVARYVAESATDSLGHGGAMTLPDRPFLRWKLDFPYPHPSAHTWRERDNQATFLEGCRKLHEFLGLFAREVYGAEPTPFEECRDEVASVLAEEAPMEGRSARWRELLGGGEPYSPELWEDQKEGFDGYPDSARGIDSHIYRFHQALCYHRYYVLKELLPRYGMAVY